MPEEERINIQKALAYAFSSTRNLKKLTSNRRPRLNIYVLSVLRTVSILWIITIHSYSFALQWLTFEQTSTKHVYKSVLAQFVANGTFSVDNFLVMSGFLAIWRRRRQAPTPPRHHEQSLSSLRANSSCLTTDVGHFFKSILRRYLRLMPLMAVMILLSVLILPKLECQPKCSNSTLMFDQWCRYNWPLNLIMVHNIISTSNMCFSHSWFVAVDFQLFVLFEFLVFISFNKPKVFSYLCLVSIAIAQIVTASIIYFNDLPPIPLVPARSPESINEFYKLIYIKPFHWASSYLIGVLLAHYLRKTKSPPIRGRFYLISVCILMMFIIICSNFTFMINEMAMTKVYASIYSLLIRPTWSLCLAIILILNYKWKPQMTCNQLITSISRLTYPAYLLHPVLMATFYGSRSETFIFSHYLLLYFTIGNTFFTYFGSLFLYLFIESPIQTLISTFNLAEQSPRNRLMVCKLRSQSNKSKRPENFSI